MNQKLLLILAYLLSSLLTSTAALAEVYQDLSVIQQTAIDYIQDNAHVADDETLDVKLSHLDSRLHLPRCRSPLLITEPMQTKSTDNKTLLVKCMDSQPWQLYLSAQVNIQKPVLVTMRSLLKGDVINADELAIETRDISHLRQGYFTDPNQLIGKALKRNLNAGVALTPGAVISPQLIKRGQLVQIIAVGNGIEVRHQGQSMSDGTLGDLISVKNLASKRVIEGQVSAAGTVKVQI